MGKLDGDAGSYCGSVSMDFVILRTCGVLVTSTPFISNNIIFILALEGT